VRVVKQSRQSQEDASDVVQHRLLGMRQIERRRFDGSNDQRRFVTTFLKTVLFRLLIGSIFRFNHHQFYNKYFIENKFLIVDSRQN
jgi:hypothetical protein